MELHGCKFRSNVKHENTSQRDLIRLVMQLLQEGISKLKRILEGDKSEVGP